MPDIKPVSTPGRGRVTAEPPRTPAQKQPVVPPSGSHEHDLKPRGKHGANAKVPLRPKTDALRAYAPEFRSEFHNRADYMDYRAAQLQTLPDPKFPGDPDTTELLPTVVSTLGGAELSRIGPHPETQLDADRPFDAVSFRTDMRPLAIRSEKMGVPQLTSNAFNCSVLWMGATDETGTKGAMVLCHVPPYEISREDFVKAAAAQLKHDGYTKLKVAVVTGATIDPEKYDPPKPKDQLAIIDRTAAALLKGVTELGFERVIDHSRQKRPHFAHELSNIGGVMKLSEKSGQVEFTPIGQGIFVQGEAPAIEATPSPPEGQAPAVAAAPEHKADGA